MTNRVLGSLAEREMRPLRPHLSIVSLAKDATLEGHGQSNRPSCYFLTAGVASCASPDQDGQPVEIGLIGVDGLVGLTLLAGKTTSPPMARMLFAGAAECIDSEMLMTLAKSEPGLGEALRAFTEAWLDQIAATALAGFRPMEQKLARWLLILGDKAGSSSLPVGVDDIARSLAASSSDARDALSLLRALGCISHDNREIRILDRGALIHETHGCYRG